MLGKVQVNTKCNQPNNMKNCDWPYEQFQYIISFKGKDQYRIHYIKLISKVQKIYIRKYTGI